LFIYNNIVMNKIAEYLAWQEQVVDNPETGRRVKVKSLPPELQKKYKPKGMVHLSKGKLEKTLKDGHFSLISAGQNGKDEKEAKLNPDHAFFKKRHVKLQKDLEDHGLKYTEVVGVYGNKEPSFLVLHNHKKPLTGKTAGGMMVHHDGNEKALHKIHELAVKYNQDSVLHGSHGHNSMVFTSGKNKGRRCGGHGYKEIPDADNYYTDIPLKKGNHTKLQMDISECFERNLL